MLVLLRSNNFEVHYSSLEEIFTVVNNDSGRIHFEFKQDQIDELIELLNKAVNEYGKYGQIGV